MNQNKRLLRMLVLGLILMLGLSACGNAEERKYVDEVNAIGAEIQDVLQNIESVDESDPESVANSLERLNSAIEYCRKLGELEAPSRYEEVQELFKEGVEFYISSFESRKLMLENRDDLGIYAQAQFDFTESLLNGAMKFAEAQELINEVQQ